MFQIVEGQLLWTMPPTAKERQRAAEAVHKLVTIEQGLRQRMMDHNSTEPYLQLREGDRFYDWHKSELEAWAAEYFDVWHYAKAEMSEIRGSRLRLLTVSEALMRAIAIERKKAIAAGQPEAEKAVSPGRGISGMTEADKEQRRFRMEQIERKHRKTSENKPAERNDAGDSGQ